LRRECAKKGGKFEHVIGCGNGEIMEYLRELLSKGKISGVIDKVYSLNDCVEAMTYLESGKAAGKVVVEVLKQK